MGWVVLTVAGLAGELTVVVLLGRGTTSRWETGADRPVREGRSGAVRTPSRWSRRRRPPVEGAAEVVSPA